MSLTGVEIGKFGQSPGEQRVHLHNVRWATYEQLLADLASQSTPRLAYEEGTLEIMTPMAEHERLKHTIELLLEFLAEELNVDLSCFGSTTFKRKDLQRGFEPDSCFYIQNEARIWGKDNIDLSVEPPPDLVIEIDITSGSMNKFGIYAQIGVPEVWRHDGTKLFIHKLSGDEYIDSQNSLAFPFLKSQQLSELINRSKNLRGKKCRETLRKWAREMRQLNEEIANQ